MSKRAKRPKLNKFVERVKSNLVDNMDHLTKNAQAEGSAAELIINTDDGQWYPMIDGIPAIPSKK